MAVIEIASLEIDIDAIISESARLRKSIDGLKQANKELDTSTEAGRKQFARNEAELRNLNKAFRDNQKFASAVISTNKDLERTLSVENKSTQELRDSRLELTKIANQIKGQNEEEIALRNKLNNAIDAQTETLRDQSSEFNTGKDSIGEYQQAIDGAIEKLGPFGRIVNVINQNFSQTNTTVEQTSNTFNQLNTSTSTVNTTVQETTKSTGGLAAGLKNAGRAFIGLTKAALAFIATPIGAILAIIGGAFLLVQNALNRSEESTNKLKRAIAPLTGIFKTILSALEPVGEFLIDGIVAGFELATEAFFFLVDAVAAGLAFLGFEETAKSVLEFNQTLRQGAADSVALAEATAKLEKSQRRARLIQLEFQKDAELLRQIRDDENLSIQERIQANDELGKVLQQQLTEELKIAEQALFVANLRVKTEGETKLALDGQFEALTEIADIQERITGQESEQLVNRVSLQREARDAAREAAEQRISDAETELQIFQQQNRVRLNTAIAAREEERDRELAIQQQRLKAGIDNEIENKLALIEIENNFQDEKKTIQDAELERIEAFENEKRDLENELALLREEDELVRAELALQQEFEEQIRALEQLAINEDEKTQLLLLLEQQRAILLQGIRDDAIKKELDAEKALFQAKQQARLQDLNDAQQEFNAATDLARSFFSDNKALQSALTIIDTFFAAQRAYASQLIPGDPTSLARATVAAIISISAGLQRVAAINKVSFAGGGILNGPSHASGGIATPFGEMQGGEAVINKRSTSLFKPLLSHINQAGGGRSFQGGGITGAGISTISNQIVSAANQVQIIDFERLAGVLVTAVESLPPPQVAVEEINTVNTRVNVIEETANVFNSNT